MRLADRRVVPVGPVVDDPPEPAGASYVLTAWNPGGREAPPEVNETANRRLVAELDRMGLAHQPAEGAAPDGSWSEPGVAVDGLDRAGAARLGAAFGQVAVYEWSHDPPMLTVVACDGSRAKGRAARVEGTPGTPPALHGP